MFAVIRALVMAGTVALAFGLNLSHGTWLPIAAMIAMKPSLEQATLVSVQRLVGALIGAAAAALLLLVPTSEHGLRLFAVERGLEVVAFVLFMHGVLRRPSPPNASAPPHWARWPASGFVPGPSRVRPASPLPLPRARQGLVEVVDVAHQLSLRRGEQRDVQQVCVPAQLGRDPRDRAGCRPGPRAATRASRTVGGSGRGPASRPGPAAVLGRTPGTGNPGQKGSSPAFCPGSAVWISDAGWASALSPGR